MLATASIDRPARSRKVICGYCQWLGVARRGRAPWYKQKQMKQLGRSRPTGGGWPTPQRYRASKRSTCRAFPMAASGKSRPAEAAVHTCGGMGSGFWSMN